MRNERGDLLLVANAERREGFFHLRARISSNFQSLAPGELANAPQQTPSLVAPARAKALTGFGDEHVRIIAFDEFVERLSHPDALTADRLFQSPVQEFFRPSEERKTQSLIVGINSQDATVVRGRMVHGCADAS